MDSDPISVSDEQLKRRDKACLVCTEVLLIAGSRSLVQKLSNSYDAGR